MPETILKTIKTSGGNYTNPADAFEDLAERRQLDKMWRFAVSGGSGSFVLSDSVEFERGGSVIGTGRFLQESSGWMRVEVLTGTPQAGDTVRKVSNPSGVLRTVGTIHNSTGEIHRLEWSAMTATLRLGSITDAPFWGGDSTRLIEFVAMNPHQGFDPGSGICRWVVNNAFSAMVTPRGAVRMVNLCLVNTNADATEARAGIETLNTSYLELINPLIIATAGPHATNGGNVGIQFNPLNAGSVYKIINPIISGFRRAINSSGSVSRTLIVYNPTLANFNLNGIRHEVGGGVNVLKIRNGVTQALNSGATDYAITSTNTTVTTDACLSGDASSPTVALRTKTVTFVDAAAHDLRLHASDAEATNNASSLDADPDFAFAYDVANTARPQGVAWDLGAHERAAAAPPAAPTISINQGVGAAVAVGGTRQLTFTISGEPAPALTGVTTDPSVATVTNAGLVTGVDLGSCTVTMTATNSEGTANDTIVIATYVGGASSGRRRSGLTGGLLG
jgi:hypothetical protein